MVLNLKIGLISIGICKTIQTYVIAVSPFFCDMIFITYKNIPRVNPIEQRYAQVLPLQDEKWLHTWSFVSVARQIFRPFFFYILF